MTTTGKDRLLGLAIAKGVKDGRRGTNRGEAAVMPVIPVKGGG